MCTMVHDDTAGIRSLCLSLASIPLRITNSIPCEAGYEPRLNTNCRVSHQRIFGRGRIGWSPQIVLWHAGLHA